jgi:hypothetical protein
MGKKLMIAVALLALMAAPAFASVQNVKVGGDIKTTSVIRSGFDLGKNTGTTNNVLQNVFLAETNLNIQADLTDNVSTVIGLKNERLWGTDEAGYSTSGHAMGTVLRLDTAYVTMKELLYSPLTVKVGRQPIKFGNQFLIGDGDATTDISTIPDITGGVNFDAVRATLAYDPLTIDIFGARASQTNAGFQDTNENVDVYGINAGYKFGDSMNTVVEAYTFAEIDKSKIAGTARDTKGEKMLVPGLRVSTNPIEGLNVQLEGAYETGSSGQAGVLIGKKNISAYGLQGMVNYALPVLKDMKPVVSGSATYLSGDNDSTAANGKNTAFNPLAGNQNIGRIFNAIFTNSNLAIYNVAFELKPIQDLTAKLSWYNLNMATREGTLTLKQYDGSTTVSPAMNGHSKALGNEFDLDLTYAYTEDVKFGVSAGYFAPAKAFTSDNKDGASQVLSSVSVAF